jgi:hypothetical protein
MVVIPAQEFMAGQ